MKSFTYPLVLSIFCAGVAHAQDAAKLAQRLVERSGVAAQMQSAPETFEERITSAGGSLPEELRLALADAGREAYRPEVLAQDIASHVAHSLKPEEMQRALAWYDTPAARSVVTAEVRAAVTMDQASVRRYAEETKDKPQSARRQELIRDLIEASNDIRLAMLVTERMGLGVAVGADSTYPAENRTGLVRLQEQADRTRPTEEMKAYFRRAMPAMYAYIYRDVSEPDLAAYLAYLHSADGKRCNDALVEAMGQALVAAAVRMGQLMEQRNARPRG
jgi:hypothetical protein